MPEAPMFVPPLEQPQPFPGLVLCHERFLNAGAYSGVAFKVHSREAGMGIVPDLCWQLVPAQEVLELLLVLRPMKQQPVGPRVANAIAEHEVQAPTDLVDKVVHVAFQAAVIVACEENPSLVVQKYPAREMDRTHAREMPAVVNVPAGVAKYPQEK